MTFKFENLGVNMSQAGPEVLVQSLILTLHIIVCFLLVVLILLQSGKEGMGVIFGGGNSSVFGSTGAGGILAKLTTLMAIIFVVTSLSYTYVTSSRPTSESVILNVQIEEPQKPKENAPAAPAEKPKAPEASQSSPAQTGSASPEAASKTPETGESALTSPPAAPQKAE